MRLHDTGEVPGLVEVDGIPTDHQPRPFFSHLLQQRKELTIFLHEDVGVLAIPEVQIGDEVDRSVGIHPMDRLFLYAFGPPVGHIANIARFFNSRLHQR